MQKRSTLKYLPVTDLLLDINNPRFGELYNASEKEDDLIEYLLYEEAAEEIAKAIVKRNQFYEDRALWVIKSTDGKYIVRDGNRRCAAVKALQMPGKYKLSEPKTIIDQLPVYEYTDEAELKARISEEHAASLFRNWERIAKALQILELAEAGKQDEMNNLDSHPGDFIKLGSFYKEAVKYGRDELRKQIRRGRGKTGGKTIIYERLFRDSKLCGYRFKYSPNFKIEITDQGKFQTYIEALVKYIGKNPEITAKDIDNRKGFIKELKDYGFDAYPKTTSPPSSLNAANSGEVIGANSSSTPNAQTPLFSGSASGSIDSGQPNEGSKSSSQPQGSAPGKGKSSKGTVKKHPKIKRKQLPPGLKARIREYFSIDSSTMPNAKVSMARVTYECVLKYVVENTKSGKIIFKNSGHFGSAYAKKPYTIFDEMNKKFIELIIDVGFEKAFKVFELEKMHQAIHNYRVSSRTEHADQINNNLIDLLEFMLQDEQDLLMSLDLSKIR